MAGAKSGAKSSLKELLTQEKLHCSRSSGTELQIIEWRAFNLVVVKL